MSVLQEQGQHKIPMNVRAIVISITNEERGFFEAGDIVTVNYSMPIMTWNEADNRYDYSAMSFHVTRDWQDKRTGEIFPNSMSGARGGIPIEQLQFIRDEFSNHPAVKNARYYNR